MLLQEWDMQTALEIRAEEAYRKGKADMEAKAKAEINRIETERDQAYTKLDQIAAEFAAYKAKYGPQLPHWFPPVAGVVEFVAAGQTMWGGIEYEWGLLLYV